MQTANWQTTQEATSGGSNRGIVAAALGIALAVALATAVALASGGVFDAPGSIGAPDPALAPGLTEFRAGEKMVGGGLEQAGSGDQSPAVGRDQIAAQRRDALNRRAGGQHQATVVHGDARAIPE